METLEGPNGSKITRTYGKGGQVREVEELRDGTTIMREKDKDGNLVSSRTLDRDKRVVETYQRNKDGSASYKIFDHKTGVTTEGEIWKNGSQVVKQVAKDGTVINEVGVTKEGNIFSYAIGGDAENAWKRGSMFSKGKYVSKRSTVNDTYGEAGTYDNPRHSEMDRKLIEQMNGGSIETRV